MVDLSDLYIVHHNGYFGCERLTDQAKKQQRKAIRHRHEEGRWRNPCWILYSAKVLAITHHTFSHFLNQNRHLNEKRRPSSPLRKKMYFTPFVRNHSSLVPGRIFVFSFALFSIAFRTRRNIERGQILSNSKHILCDNVYINLPSIGKLMDFSSKNETLPRLVSRKGRMHMNNIYLCRFHIALIFIG